MARPKRSLENKLKRKIDLLFDMAYTGKATINEIFDLFIRDKEDISITAFYNMFKTYKTSRELKEVEELMKNFNSNSDLAQLNEIGDRLAHITDEWIEVLKDEVE